MKARKILKRLNKVNAWLSRVLDQNAAKKPRVRELLTSAKESVSHAQQAIQAPASTPASKSASLKKSMRAKSRKPARQAAKPKPLVKAKPVARKKAVPATSLNYAPPKIARASDRSGRGAPQAELAVPTASLAPRL